MADANLFLKALWYLIKTPFSVFLLLFKLKIKHTLAIIFIITMTASAFIGAVKERNPGIFVLEVARHLIGADNNLSLLVEDLATTPDMGLAAFLGKLWLGIGSLYLLVYIYNFVHMGIQNIYADARIVQTIWIILPLMFVFKMLFFAVQEDITGNNVDMLDSEIWANSLPFKFLYDIWKYRHEIIINIAPAIEEAKNVSGSLLYKNLSVGGIG